MYFRGQFQKRSLVLGEEKSFALTANQIFSFLVEHLLLSGGFLVNIKSKQCFQSE